jgi:DNA-binding transcriptional ArsR family regulator
MQTEHAITALGALAQHIRLAVFRLLVQAGPAGLAASRIAQELDVAPSSLSFHLKELSHAGLIVSQQTGRFVIYSANFETMNTLVAYLTENCCGGIPCMPSALAGCNAPATPSPSKLKATTP